MMYVCMYVVPTLLAWSIYKLRTGKINIADNIVAAFFLFFIQNFCTCLISSLRGCIGFYFQGMSVSYAVKYTILSCVIGVIIAMLLKNIRVHTYSFILSSRNGTIDFMKFIFSIIIVLFHSASITGESNRLFVNGRIGVEFFFLVSGFLMAKSANSYIKEKSIGKATKDFIWKKIKGMCPEVYIAFVFAFFVKHLISDISACKLIKDLINSVFELLFLRMGGLLGYSVNGNTWYISAMLLAMLILFPILLKNRDTYLYIVAPIISIFFLGYLCMEKGSVGVNGQWTGIVRMGLLRGMAEIALGSICYFICTEIRKYNFTNKMKYFLALVEVVLYAYVIIDIYINKTSQMDFVLIMLLAVAIVISFSEQSMMIKVFNKPIFTWLGRFSFPIFLGHGFWRTSVTALFVDCSSSQLFAMYLLLTFFTVIAITVISELLRDYRKKIYSCLKKQCIKENI